MKPTPPSFFWKICFAVVVFFVFKTPVFLQTFNGQGNLPIPPGAPAQTVGITTSICSVSGVGVLGGCKHIDNVTINLLHTWDGDIAIFLIGPGGQVLEFSSGNGGPGDNFTNTIFKDSAPQFITSGSPPFTGQFRPEGRQQSTTPPFPNTAPLGTFTFANLYDGTDADGDWTLLINDYVPADVGTLISWSMTFTSAGVGNTVTIDLTPTPICQGQTGQATLTLNFSGPTPAGTTYNAVITKTPGGTLNFNNLVPNGMVWTTSIPFPAATTTYTLTTITANTGCQPVIGPPSSVTLVVNPPPTASITGDLMICSGESTTLTASGGVSYLWSNAANTDIITVSPTNNQSYTVTATDANGCTGTKSVVVQVVPHPTISLAAVPPLVCEDGCKTVTATLTGAAPFSFSYEFQVAGNSVSASTTVNSATNMASFQACPPSGVGSPIQVVVCTLSDLNCTL